MTPEVYKHLELPNSQLELTKHCGWEGKHLKLKQFLWLNYQNLLDIIFKKTKKAKTWPIFHTKHLNHGYDLDAIICNSILYYYMQFHGSIICYLKHTRIPSFIVHSVPLATISSCSLLHFPSFTTTMEAVQEKNYRRRECQRKKR